MIILVYLIGSDPGFRSGLQDLPRIVAVVSGCYVILKPKSRTSDDDFQRLWQDYEKLSPLQLMGCCLQNKVECKRKLSER